jgi:D-arabinose 1-dehydrogenase-like Zn-dependent alcohol dehydrogenase
VGIHLVQVARLFGARVAGLDVSDEKLAAIEELGATAVRSDDFASVDPGIWTDGGPTVVVDFLGRPETIDWALRAVERGGRVVFMTSFRGLAGELEPRNLVENELSVLGSRYATRREVGMAAELVASGRIRPIIGEVRHASEAIAIHDALRQGRLIGRGAITWN